jgi:hypothetical protein
LRQHAVQIARLYQKLKDKATCQRSIATSYKLIPNQASARALYSHLRPVTEHFADDIGFPDGSHVHAEPSGAQELGDGLTSIDRNDGRVRGCYFEQTAQR